jgi:hypothetical protein
MDFGCASGLAAPPATSPARISVDVHSAISMRAHGLSPLVKRVLRLPDRTSAAQSEGIASSSIDRRVGVIMNAESAATVSSLAVTFPLRSGRFHM